MPTKDNNNGKFVVTPFLKSLTDLPGVYQMFDTEGDILYVGKAKNLKKRVTSYFTGRHEQAKTELLVSKIASIQVTVTESETAALLLEQNLIKQQRPPYNILLRDDKSFPYISVSDHEWPRLGLHRGAKNKKSQYFGPFPNVNAARETLSMLQKVFKVRQCEDGYFRNRSRPCLQHQINRCTAPCVGLVEANTYQQDLKNSISLLNGEDKQLSQQLAEKMNTAAEALEFEKAGQLRDQIHGIRQIQAEQSIEKGRSNIDVVSVALDGDESCIHMLFVRQGRIVGSRSFFPKPRLQESAAQLLGIFLAQYYLTGPQERIPNEVLTSHDFVDANMLANALKQVTSRKVGLRKPQRGVGVQWLQMAGMAAEQNLIGRKASQKTYQNRLDNLQSALRLSSPLNYLECYDISHTQGKLTVGSCVVFDRQGPNKKEYRRFNISGITGGDDYAAMEQVLTRRFKRVSAQGGAYPDLLVIDGGKGQLGKVMQVLDMLGIADVLVLGIAKGTNRKSGWERFFLGGNNKEIVIDSQSPEFHLLQHIRDESHRFAITGHVARRDKKFIESPLEAIVGIGAKRRKNLVDYFGGYKGIEQASVADLNKVTGVSKKMAQTIYDYFHG